MGKVYEQYVHVGGVGGSVRLTVNYIDGTRKLCARLFSGRVANTNAHPFN